MMSNRQHVENLSSMAMGGATSHMNETFRYLTRLHQKPNNQNQYYVSIARTLVSSAFFHPDFGHPNFVSLDYDVEPEKIIPKLCNQKHFGTV